jgi:biotin-dependent carboxylase-like uncharacterized protein
MTSGNSGRSITVLQTGPLTTVQDEGRLGQGAIGIGRSGACDRASFRLANRLLGNAEGAAALEVTFGGLVLRADSDVMVVSTGARCAGLPHNAPAMLGAGSELRLTTPSTGLRTYVAVRGGFDVPPVLGSRSTDMLSGLGPPIVRAGDQIEVGTAYEQSPLVDVAPVPNPEGGEVVVRVTPGPRRDWFSEAAWSRFVTQTYQVSSESNRVGLRLEGQPLERRDDSELPSEGMVRGAVQIPASGEPVLFLADHPVTGGYPVIAYVHDRDVDRCAQLRPGQTVRFQAVSRGTRGSTRVP